MSRSLRDLNGTDAAKIRFVQAAENVGVGRLFEGYACRAVCGAALAGFLVGAFPEVRRAASGLLEGFLNRSR
jgi:hypothetical protein